MIDFSQEFILKARIARDLGVNIYALTNRFYKVRRLNEKLPEAVLMAVLDEVLSRGTMICDPWPYFIKVLQSKSEAHFSKRNEQEGTELKKQRANTMLIGEIMRRMS